MHTYIINIYEYMYTYMHVSTSESIDIHIYTCMHADTQDHRTWGSQQLALQEGDLRGLLAAGLQR